MNSARRVLLMILLAGLFAQAALWGQARGRIWGRVADENGEPLLDVKITVVYAPEDKVITERTTKKRGSYSIALVDATRPYMFRFELEGYQTHEEVIKIPVQGNLKRDFVLHSWSYLRQHGEQADIESEGDAPQVIPGDPAATAYNQGVAAMREEDYALAEEKLLRALSLDAKLQVAHSAISRVYLAQKEHQKAAQSAEQALELNSDDEGALSVRYQAYEALGDTAQAKDAYDKLAALTAPAVAAYNIAVDAFQAGSLETARSKFQEAVELDTKLLPGYLALARVLYQLEDYGGAATAIDTALELDASNVNAMAIRYDVYRQLGDPAKIQEALAALKEVAPERLTGSYYEKGVELFNNNQIAEAQAAFQEVVATDPNHARAHYMLGLSYAATDAAKAKEHLQKYLELDPNDTDAALARQMIDAL